jgi:hypothetical protein
LKDPRLFAVPATFRSCPQGRAPRAPPPLRRRRVGRRPLRGTQVPAPTRQMLTQHDTRLREPLRQGEPPRAAAAKGRDRLLSWQSRRGPDEQEVTSLGLACGRTDPSAPPANVLSSGAHRFASPTRAGRRDRPAIHVAMRPVAHNEHSLRLQTPPRVPDLRFALPDWTRTNNPAITRMAFTVIMRCVPNIPLTCDYLALGHVCPYRDAPPMSAIFQG